MDCEQIIEKMALKDKIALCSGADFWRTKGMERYGIPSLFMCDGPHGLRKQEDRRGTDMLGINRSRPATCFPAAVTTASSWDPGLLEQIGAAIGEEAAACGVGLVLGPGANCKRDPLCGRNFEYFSEDPLLAGKLAAGFIRGVQSNGVAASLKHFACNNQEYRRMNSDSVLDERTLREIYLTAFEIAVKEGRPATVMCAYNKVNGTYCSDNAWLLTDLLRREWGFGGLVVTDWGAMSSRIEGFRAGCDLNMPGGSAYMEKAVLEAVESGRLPESEIDRSVRRVLDLVFRAQDTLKGEHAFDQEAHHALAVRAAEQGAVLLKNEGLLPLERHRKVALIGHMAKEMRYQGSGSSHINPLRLVHPLDAMPGAVYAPGCDGEGGTDEKLLRQAAEAAGEADVAVVFAGLPDRYESEGFDRDGMEMPEGHIRMIEAVAAANPNTVVVLFCGSPVECPWADHVKAILYMGLPGQGGGQAAADLLYGRANPSGKLAESWPVRYEDCPTAGHYRGRRDAQYREGVYVGYRYYGRSETPVRWPFGHGLSYTSFSYSDLRVERGEVTVRITNTGARAGAETAQLYIAPPAGGLHRPARELKGFCKVFLEPGESAVARFLLDERSFAVWADGWKIPGGTYTVLVGPSSAQLPLRAAVEREGTELPAPSWQAGSWYETMRGRPTQKEWEAMLGRTYRESAERRGTYNMDSTVEEMMADSLVMKLLYQGIRLAVTWGVGGRRNRGRPEYRMIMTSSAGCPLRSMQINGGLRDGLMQGLLEMANGHFLRGIGRMLRG